MYKVIDGRQLKIREKPGYYLGGLTEEDYKEFVFKSQDYIIKGDFDDRETRVCGKSAYALWVDPCRAVVVEQVGRKYRVTNNGNHRAYIAHKYGLKLLVYIDDDTLPGDYPLF